MWIHHSNTVVTAEQLAQLKGLIRELQPDCLINSRLGLSIEEDPDVDFRTMGDNQLGQHRLDYPWQSPATVAHSWGFHALDGRWKPTTALLHALINNVSLNGNFMLNIGPRSNGDVPLETVERLEEMGDWLAENGDAIYGAGAFDLRKDLHHWGRITHRAGPGAGHTLYLHVYTWPFNRELPLTGVGTAPRRAYLLADEAQSPLPVRHEGLLTTVSLPATPPDGRVSVVALEYGARPAVETGLVARTVDGGFSLTHGNLLSESGERRVKAPTRGGTVPAHVVAVGDYASRWKVFVERPGRVRVDASYAFQGEAGDGTLAVEMAGAVIEHAVSPTGQTVGEPNQSWHIDNFVSRRVGMIEIPEAGVYEVALAVKGGSGASVKLQWLWLAPENQGRRPQSRSRTSR
jgi:alpha-L-fucosidase